MIGGCLECDAYKVGDNFIIDGISYTVADRKMILDAIASKNDVSGFCTSRIVDMSNLVSKSGAQEEAPTSFNQDISSWDVSNVYNMDKMFYLAEAFNQDIGNWDVSNVTSMKGTFWGAGAFNQDIGNWDVSNVKDMNRMFLEAKAFNQDIGNWDVSNVTDMRGMFAYSAFNQNIGKWDVSNVTGMGGPWYTNGMFAYSAFNQDIGNWDVSNVDDMSFMFVGAEAFNQDIGNWDVSNVDAMSFMFLEAKAFNQDIGNWDVSNVDDMGYFEGMEGMFNQAKAFNQDLTHWCVTSIKSLPRIFCEESGLAASYHPLWGTCPEEEGKAHSPLTIENRVNTKTPQEESSQNETSTTNHSSFQPDNGYSPYDEIYGAGIYHYTENSIQVKAPSQRDIVFLLKNLSTGRFIRNEYIKRGSTFSLTEIPYGDYKFYYTSGTSWSENESFKGQEGAGNFTFGYTITKSEDIKDFEFEKGYAGEYTLVLQMVENGNLESEPATEDEI